MKHFIPFLFSFLVFTGMVNAQDKDFHIYLAFGQSNMEGSAKVRKSTSMESIPAYGDERG